MFDHNDFSDFMQQSRDRAEHIRSRGFVRVEASVVQALVKHGPWVEIGAGTGALAAAVNAAGGRVVPTDNFSWAENRWDENSGGWVGRVQKVIKADGVRAARLVARTPSIGLLSCWPCYDEDWAYRAVSLLRPGQRFAYFGEGDGGCTGDDQLHDLLDCDFEEIQEVNYEQWPGLYDRLTIYRRNS